MKKIVSLLVLLMVIFMQSDASAQKKMEKATFAGGCFWCMESPFEKLPGVGEVVPGYTGGTGEDPVYEDYGDKGHIEAVQVQYDPSKITYEELLDVFWRQIDPFDAGGQFCDRGPEYTTAIFFHTQEQKQSAERSKERLEKIGGFKEPIVTRIIPAFKFYAAEDYHQNYYKKNPERYKIYRFSCGRDPRVKEIWEGVPVLKKQVRDKPGFKKPGKEELKKMLTLLQYQVTQEDGTEPAFKNEYADNKKEGIYVDLVSGEPLFSSIEKFDSKTGWPSFSKPLEPKNIIEKEDRSLFMKRTEIRSKQADSHLGHVFNDGPQPTGLRYCINSAALRFVPKEDLEKEGYDEYRKLF